MDSLAGLVQRYIACLEAGAADAQEYRDRANYAERLSAAGEIAAALNKGDLGRAASIVYTEERAIGWGHLAGVSGGPARDAFAKLRAEVKDARLRDRPDAGFGH